MSHDGFGGFDVGHDGVADSGDGAGDTDLASLKEAFELPDELPPIRLPSLAELAAQAREAPLTSSLDALAAWTGPGGREVDAEGDLSPSDAAAAAAAAGVSPDDFAYLWEYALAVDWLVFDEAGEDLVLPGETAEAWAGDADDDVVYAWSVTLAAVLDETLEVAGPDLADELTGGEFDADSDDSDRFDDSDEFGEFEEEDGEDGDDEDEAEPALDFRGLPLGLVILLFSSRGESVSRAELTEVFWADAAVELTAAQAAVARAEWEAAYGDPVLLLLGKLSELRAVTRAGDDVELAPLALATLREQLVEAGVDVPLLPPTAAQLTAAELLAMAPGVSEEEFYAEAEAWAAARGAAPAARQLLDLAARGDPGERLLAVAAVTRMGPGAAPAWRDSLTVPQVRGYAKIHLSLLAGDGDGEGPPELDPLPEDLAWMATDLLVLACDDEFPDPGELAVTFREAVPPGGEAALFDAMSRGVHPDALTVLNYVGKYHPDRRVAKEARTAAYKAAARVR